MAEQQSRKRKTDHKKNSDSLPKKTMNRKAIESSENDWMPAAAVKFFEREDFQKIENNMKLIDKKICLVGPFRKLKEESDVTGIDLIMLDREETDLPEMQTFLLSSVGRFAFWRDTPSEKNPVIVFVDTQNFPKITVVGNLVEHAIHSFCSKIKTHKANSKETKTTISDIQDLLGTQNMEQEYSQIIKKRQNEMVTGAAGVGLLVESFNNKKTGPRYQVSEKGTPDIDSLMCFLSRGKEKDPKAVELIEVLMGNVMMYNDEGYYGNGLELGHVLFLANQKSMKDKVELILTMAYTLYNRSDFYEILNLTLELRDH